MIQGDLLFGVPLPPGHPSYLPRKADRQLLEELLVGGWCRVLAPKRVGKTSLRLATAACLTELDGRLGPGCAAIEMAGLPTWQAEAVRVAQSRGAQLRSFRCAHIDLQQLAGERRERSWYWELCSTLRQQLAPEFDLEQLWSEPAKEPAHYWIRFLTRLLATETRQLVLLFDEIEVLAELPFGATFWNSLRPLADRTDKPVLQRLSLVLFGTGLSEDLYPSGSGPEGGLPFRTLELDDFSEEDLLRHAPLFDLLQHRSFHAPQLLIRLAWEQTHGHPEQTSRLLEALLTTEQPKVELPELLRQVFLASFPGVDDALLSAERYLLQRFLGGEGRETIDRVGQVMVRGSAPWKNDLAGCRGLMSGALSLEKGRLVPRNAIHKSYFDPARVEGLRAAVELRDGTLGWQASGQNEAQLLRLPRAQQLLARAGGADELLGVQPPARFLATSLDRGWMRRWRRTRWLLTGVALLGLLVVLGAYGYANFIAPKQRPGPYLSLGFPGWDQERKISLPAEYIPVDTRNYPTFLDAFRGLKDRIDVVAFSSKVYADLVSTHPEDFDSFTCFRPSSEPEVYHSLMLALPGCVEGSEKVAGAEALLKAALKKNARFVFADPQSVSGYAVPVSWMSSVLGVDFQVQTLPCRFSRSHPNSAEAFRPAALQQISQRRNRQEPTGGCVIYFVSDRGSIAQESSLLDQVPWAKVPVDIPVSPYCVKRWGPVSPEKLLQDHGIAAMPATVRPTSYLRRINEGAPSQAPFCDDRVEVQVNARLPNAPNDERERDRFLVDLQAQFDSYQRTKFGKAAVPTRLLPVADKEYSTTDEWSSDIERQILEQKKQVAWGGFDIAVYDVDSILIPQFVSKDMLVAQDLTEEEKDSFHTSALEAFSQDRNLYALPSHLDFRVLFYRKDLMANPPDTLQCLKFNLLCWKGDAKSCEDEKHYFCQDSHINSNPDVKKPEYGVLLAAGVFEGFWCHFLEIFWNLGGDTLADVYGRATWLSADGKEDKVLLTVEYLRHLLQSNLLPRWSLWLGPRDLKGAPQDVRDRIKFRESRQPDWYLIASFLGGESVFLLSWPSYAAILNRSKGIRWTQLQKMIDEEVKDPIRSDQIGMAPILSSSSSMLPISTFGGSGVAVAKLGHLRAGETEQDRLRFETAARQVAFFLTSPQRQIEQAKSTGRFPAMKDDLGLLSDFREKVPELIESYLDLKQVLADTQLRRRLPLSNHLKCLPAVEKELNRVLREQDESNLELDRATKALLRCEVLP